MKNKSLRILLIAPTYFHASSVIGGGERYVHELARALARRASVEVFSFGSQSHGFAEGSVRFSVFKCTQFRHFTLTNPFCLRHFFRIRRADWDLVHVHQLCTFVSDLACLAASRAGIPVVGTDHGGGGAWVLNQRFSIYPRYSKVIGQSDCASSLLAPEFPDRVVTIKGGVDTEAYSPAPADRNAPFILFVGRLLPHKGVHTLVEAFARADLAGYRLVLVGRAMDPAYLSHLQALAGGAAVEFRTAVRDAELKQLYQQASLTVLPSESQGNQGAPPELMGFTSLESQASGTPVVVSDAGPMREFIAEDQTGAVFRVGDVSALADCLKHVLAWYERAEPGEIAQRCATHVQQFSWETVASRHLKLYQSLIST